VLSGFERPDAVEDALSSATKGNSDRGDDGSSSSSSSSSGGGGGGGGSSDGFVNLYAPQSVDAGGELVQSYQNQDSDGGNLKTACK
jgi:hypothetical protein